MAGKVLITGDTHGDFSRFQNIDPLGIDRDDVVIIAGDFGGIWDQEETARERLLLDRVRERPWTTAFVCGNHENFDRLDTLPVEEKWGGKVGRVNESIFHLKRGEIYTIGGQKIFCFGGAASIDKMWRTEGVSWWPQEIPSVAEMDYALENLEKHGNKVDLVITHTMPHEAVQEFEESGLSPQGFEAMALKMHEPTPKFLSEILDRVDFGAWFCGHFHVDTPFLGGSIQCLYEMVVDTTVYQDRKRKRG